MVKKELWGETVDLEIPEDVFPTEEDLKQLDEDINYPEHGASVRLCVGFWLVHYCITTH